MEGLNSKQKAEALASGGGGSLRYYSDTHCHAELKQLTTRFWLSKPVFFLFFFVFFFLGGGG